TPRDVDLGSLQFLTSGSVPARQGATVKVRWPAVRGRQDLPVGGKREVLCPGACHRRKILSGGDVPNAELPWVVPHGETLAIGTKDEASDAAVLLLELADFPAGVRLPHTNDLILTAGRQELAVRRDSKAEDASGKGPVLQGRREAS